MKSLVALLVVVNTMFISRFTSSGSGRSRCLKHRVDTSSIKNARHDFLMDFSVSLSLEREREREREKRRNVISIQIFRNLTLFSFLGPSPCVAMLSAQQQLWHLS